ncbi:hypothetical protein ABI_42260 [Asticcacaulis biprosthecium C19]|uniref:DUF1579 domain-containing protein n=1 Tax=Asticcacaulis biprosthecium C19 TaxID=715226 RepID=F4QST3_9CAUL|nr:hypothetical protein [Asticcacaulis biprosthecium]EGF89803.1 hypothetical protein ABI_42260 [Asticcacaulis biprosthecium C19]
MFKAIVCAAALAAMSVSAVCAQEAAKPAANAAAIAKLDGMKGVWKGEAQGFNQSGPFKLTQTERVGTMLGGDVLVIEGRGYDPAGALQFNAFAILSWSNDKQKYELQAYNAGRSGTFKFDLTPTGAVWEIPAGPNARVVNTITLSGDTWHEVQEYVAEGQPARKIFEMNLKRVSETEWPAAGAVTP